MSTSAFAAMMAAPPTERPVIVTSVLPRLRHLAVQAAAKDAAMISGLVAETITELQSVYQLLAEVKEWVGKSPKDQSNLQMLDMLDRLSGTLAAGAAAQAADLGQWEVIGASGRKLHGGSKAECEAWVAAGNVGGGYSIERSSS